MLTILHCNRHYLAHFMYEETEFLIQLLARIAAQVHPLQNLALPYNAAVQAHTLMGSFKWLPRLI